MQKIPQIVAAADDTFTQALARSFTMAAGSMAFILALLLRDLELAGGARTSG